jgi:hypothetical protein
MNYNRQLTGQVVQEYLDRFPDTSSLCLAKLIYRENIELFSCVEHVRTIIRYYRGANGIRARNRLQNKSYVRQQI